MRKTGRMVLLAAGILFLFTAVAYGAHMEDLNTIKEGDSVPAFSGRDLSGDTVDFGALIGKKVVVLSFWSIYCKPCVEEISSLIRLQEEFGGADLEVIGVNTDGELGIGRIRKFVSRFEEYEKKSINYRIIFDEENKITKMLGIGFLPTVLSINIKGQVEKMFVGYQDQSEGEIFEGIRALLPSATGVAAGAGEPIFTADAVVPLCGFYGPKGWLGSFTGNKDLEVEVEKAAEMARLKATKLIVKDALISLGINLAEDPEKEECFRPYGVFLMESPMETKDNLTNLVNELNLNRLVQVQETQEDFLGTEYRVHQRATVNLSDLKDTLDKLGYTTPPRTISFSIVNVKKLDRVKFEQILLQQSRHIGYFNFPTYTIYTTPENFGDELEKMDLEGLKLFIEDIYEDRLELEVWR